MNTFIYQTIQLSPLFNSSHTVKHKYTNVMFIFFQLNRDIHPWRSFMQNMRNITVSLNACEPGMRSIPAALLMTFNEKGDGLMCCELGICSDSAAAMKASVGQGTHFGTVSPRVQRNLVPFQP